MDRYGRTRRNNNMFMNVNLVGGQSNNNDIEMMGMPQAGMAGMNALNEINPVFISSTRQQ